MKCYAREKTTRARGFYSPMFYIRETSCFPHQKFSMFCLSLSFFPRLLTSIIHAFILTLINFFIASIIKSVRLPLYKRRNVLVIFLIVFCQSAYMHSSMSNSPTHIIFWAARKIIYVLIAAFIVRLHDVLDIRECICQERSSCYAGRQRSNRGQQSFSLFSFAFVASIVALELLLWTFLFQYLM